MIDSLFLTLDYSFLSNKIIFFSYVNKIQDAFPISQHSVWAIESHARPKIRVHYPLPKRLIKCSLGR